MATQQYPVEFKSQLLQPASSWRAALVIERLQILTELEQALLVDSPSQESSRATWVDRLLGPNPWLFGDEFLLAMRAPKPTLVASLHMQEWSTDALTDQPMMWSLNESESTSGSHLVVLAGSATAELDGRAISAIEGLAASIAMDDRGAGARSRWTFLAIAGTLGTHAAFRMREHGDCIVRQGSTVVLLKTWRQLVDEQRARLHAIIPPHVLRPLHRLLRR
ncbi:hypothetical protein [Mitsuaria sp. GD03876]|uniref:hypothetical protein n=1 Tax=Mitsuaria sp. GD03876 TaxID=2975399 RepID=UPI002448E464|nr:hypothetical protein [Mitsuaria sp. GD03876]MDH0864419.1 hypothetical protein [Mitsuaria sp. GD03876]